MEDLNRFDPLRFAIDLAIGFVCKKIIEEIKKSSDTAPKKES